MIRIVRYLVPRLSVKSRTFCAVLVSLLVWGRPLASDLHTPSTQAVIVDTDMALDDVRALILLTQLPSVEIAAVVTSDGSSSPRRGAQNALAILQALGKKTVPVGAGDKTGAAPPLWRAMSESIGAESLSPAAGGLIPAAEDVLQSACSLHPGGITYLCLGPSSNLAKLIRTDSALARQAIHRVYSQGDCGRPDWVSWNTRRDTLAARIVMRSGLPVYACLLPDSAYLRLSDAMLTEIQACSTAASNLMILLHSESRVRELVHSGHFRCWDETVVLSWADSALARFEPVDDSLPCRTLAGWDAHGAQGRYVELLCGKDNPMDRLPTTGVGDPTAPFLLADDLRPVAADIIGRHGPGEWRAVILTTELHGHLGIYAIIGVKMGIRALDLLGATAGDIVVISEAGQRPPLSCLNDGLQVATGATLGQGTITVLAERTTPSASFTGGSRHLHLKLKEQIAREISDAIEQLAGRAGGLTSDYWARLRELAIQHWRDLDRREIFDESWE